MSRLHIVFRCAIVLECVAFFCFVAADMTILRTSRGYPFLALTTVGGLIVITDLVNFAIQMRMSRDRRLPHTPESRGG